MELDMGRKIFISHSSKDKEYGQAMADLLQEIGLAKRVFFSSDVGTGIPVNQDIFQYLDKQIRGNAYMLFLLSENFYESIACLNEMGAAWGRENICALLIVPGFHIGNAKLYQSAVNPRQIAVEMDDSLRIRQLVQDILDKCSVQTDGELVDNACRDYIEKVQKIQERPDIQKWNELWETERELERDVRNPGLYTKRGRILMEIDKRNYQKAVMDYLYAIFLKPDYFSAYSELIQAAAKNGDYEQAMWFAEEACRRFPKNGNSYGCRAYVKCQEGFYSESIKDCDIAISLLDNRWFYNTRGRCYMKCGSLWEALTDFWTAHKKDPQYLPAIENIKNVVEKIGYSEMLKAFEEYKAKALKNDGQGEYFNKALMCIECLQVYDSTREEVLREYGGWHYDFGRYADALEYWEKALEVNNNCWYNYLCGLALEYQGKYAQARAYYRIALEFPDDFFRECAKKHMEQIDKND